MQTMYASEYATHSGYPLLTVKNFCKEKILPNEKIGRKYLIDVSVADEILKQRRMTKQTTDHINNNVVSITSKQQSKSFNFLDELNKLQKRG
jgi:hypothetical protein